MQAHFKRVPAPNHSDDGLYPQWIIFYLSVFLLKCPTLYYLDYQNFPFVKYVAADVVICKVINLMARKIQ